MDIWGQSGTHLNVGHDRISFGGGTASRLLVMEADLKELIAMTDWAVAESKDMIAEVRGKIRVTEKTIEDCRKLLEPEKSTWTGYQFFRYL